MEVLANPDKRLRQQSSEIVFFDEFLDLFVKQMTETMYAEGGVGLAAPQVGVNRKIIVVDPSGGEDAKQFLALVNPKIVSRSGLVDSEEGCLSIPGFRGTVQRSLTIDVEYQDLEGNAQKLTATGFLSIVIQHEIDHLQGILFLDRAKNVKLTQKPKKALERTV